MDLKMKVVRIKSISAYCCKIFSHPLYPSYDMTVFRMVIIWQLSGEIQRGFIYGEQTLIMIAWLMPISMMPQGYLGFPIFPLVSLSY